MDLHRDPRPLRMLRVECDPALFDRLRVLAREHETSIAELIRISLEESYPPDEQENEENAP